MTYSPQEKIDKLLEKGKQFFVAYRKVNLEKILAVDMDGKKLIEKFEEMEGIGIASYKLYCEKLKAYKDRLDDTISKTVYPRTTAKRGPPCRGWGRIF